MLHCCRTSQPAATVQPVRMNSSRAARAAMTTADSPTTTRRAAALTTTTTTIITAAGRGAVRTGKKPPQRSASAFAASCTPGVHPSILRGARCCCPNDCVRPVCTFLWRSPWVLHSITSSYSDLIHFDSSCHVPISFLNAIGSGPLSRIPQTPGEHYCLPAATATTEQPPEARAWKCTLQQAAVLYGRKYEWEIVRFAG